MTRRVKEFIEDNIETIEIARWEELFETWYDETLDELGWTDAEEISDLFEVLKTLNVTKETTLADRKAVIEKHVEEIVNDTIKHNNNIRDTWYIKWDWVTCDLKSDLGLTYAELRDILNNIDMSGVTPDEDNNRFAIYSF